MNILIIDDEIPICELMDEFLSQQGHQVSTAIDGKDGISKFKKLRPEVVILDIRMPGIGGIDVLRRIRMIDTNVVVIMLSAFGDFHTIQESMHSGANYYMEKPLDFKELLKILHDTKGVK